MKRTARWILAGSLLLISGMGTYYSVAACILLMGGPCRSCQLAAANSKCHRPWWIGAASLLAGAAGVVTATRTRRGRTGNRAPRP